MPHGFVKQPNGRYAIFSTIVDDFILLDATAKEAFEEEIRRCKGYTYPGNLEHDLRRGIGNLEVDGRNWEWSPDWQEAIRTIIFTHGPEFPSRAAMLDLGLISEAQVSILWDLAKEERGEESKGFDR